MNIDIRPKFQIVTPDEGYVLTNYMSEQDIKEYDSFMSCYCPLDCDHKHIREITVEEDTVLRSLRDKALGYDTAEEHNR